MELWQLVAQPYEAPPIGEAQGAARAAGPALQAYLFARWQFNVLEATKAATPEAQAFFVAGAATIQKIMRELYATAPVKSEPGSV